ncbi:MULTISPECIES: UvrD-helicase domain-containing protein [unclassified Rhizobium]|uniref:UvrD-helicase domain-containing protein n=1 Tax=unclassified Rhizobium TaxID=2613769 RepID=UPI0038080D01
MVFVWGKDDLNEEQVDAIEHPGSVFLSACPGSGKTRALTYKIALELSRLESEKQWVVAITYTHRAAEEIEERIERLGVDTSRLWIGTIHSFCLDWILRPYAILHEQLKHGFRVVDQHESERRLDALGSQMIPRIGSQICGYYFTTTNVVLAAPPNRRASVRSMLETFWAQLREERRVDFEMILRYAWELVRDNPSISILLSRIFKFILVDEVQDTKEIQYAVVASILKAGAGRTQAFLVGDPNQSIFTSLGGYAMPRADFEQLSGLAMEPKSLSINYRSSERIVEYYANYHVVPAVVTAEGQVKDYPSKISFDQEVAHQGFEDEIVRLIRYNIEHLHIPPNEICIVGPWWVSLAALTRRLMGAMPDQPFDGPGMAPFARDQDNFWYKVARLALTEPSPRLFVRRLRWAGEVLADLHHAGVALPDISRRDVLRICNSIQIDSQDGLEFLRLFFDEFSDAMGFDPAEYVLLAEHHETFFARSERQIERLQASGVQGVNDIGMFRRTFASRTGITISTIHGVKGLEFDTVIAFALLEGMVPHFADENKEESAKKLLYVICSRPRKNLHLISEAGRLDGRGGPYVCTAVLADCQFSYSDIPVGNQDV